jgi:hypothetical protein
MESFVKRSCR